jgi:RNA polymerase sigma-70 factor, ECF subfamily
LGVVTENAHTKRGDDELLMRTTSDPEAFGEFYDRFETPVLTFFYRATGRAEIAADLAAETFAAALASARRFDPGSGSARGWLFGIARHLLADTWERRRVENNARRRLALEPLALTDETIERIEQLGGGSGVLELLDALPDDQRTAVTGRVVDGRDYGELAVAILVLAITTLGHRGRPAPAPHTSVTPSSVALHGPPSEARSLVPAASQLLRTLVLPAGARAVASDPSSPARLGNPAQQTLDMPVAADVHSFWRFPGTVAAAAAWFQRHPPRGGSVSQTEELGSGGGGRRAKARKRTIVEWDGVYLFGTPGVRAQQLEISLAPAKGGGVAMRADGQSGLATPRPPTERIPAGTTRVTVAYRVATHGRSLPVVRHEITSRARITAVVNLINVLPAAHGCRKAGAPRADLTFDTSTSSTPLAGATINFACDTVTLALPGRPTQTLALGVGTNLGSTLLIALKPAL